MFSKRTEWKLTPNRFSQAQAEVRDAGVDALDLSVSNPTRAGFPYDAETILQSLVQPEALDYDPQPKGMLTARQAVTRYYHDAHGLYDLDPESLILTTSTSEGYSYVFRLLCNPEDEILVPKPSYPLFEFLADLQDLDRHLARQKACERLSVEGGWYVILRVPALQSDEDLAIDLLRTVGVLVHPGHFYDFPRDGYLVLSLITPTDVFHEGIRRILGVLSE